MYKPSKYLDQDAVLYDVVNRNKLVLKDEDDGDDTP